MSRWSTFYFCYVSCVLALALARGHGLTSQLSHTDIFQYYAKYLPKKLRSNRIRNFSEMWHLLGFSIFTHGRFHVNFQATDSNAQATTPRSILSNSSSMDFLPSNQVRPFSVTRIRVSSDSYVFFGHESRKEIHDFQHRFQTQGIHIPTHYLETNFASSWVKRRYFSPTVVLCSTRKTVAAIGMPLLFSAITDYSPIPLIWFISCHYCVFLFCHCFPFHTEYSQRVFGHADATGTVAEVGPIAIHVFLFYKIIYHPKHKDIRSGPPHISRLFDAFKFFYPNGIPDGMKICSRLSMLFTIPIFFFKIQYNFDTNGNPDGFIICLLFLMLFTILQKTRKMCWSVDRIQITAFNVSFLSQARAPWGTPRLFPRRLKKRQGRLIYSLAFENPPNLK